MPELKTALMSKTLLTIFALASCFWAGCSPKSSAPTEKTNATAPLQVSFIPVENPVSKGLCNDDTLSPTEYFNAPVVRFSGTAIDLFGRPVKPKDLQDWAMKYYEHKVARGLWVQIAPGSVGNAEQALAPVVRMFPDLHLFQIEYGFSCPKTPR